MSEDRDCQYNRKVIDTLLSVLSLSPAKGRGRYFSADSRSFQDFFHKRREEYKRVLGGIRFSNTSGGPYSHDLSDALQMLKAMGDVYFATPAVPRSPYVFAGGTGDISDAFMKEDPDLKKLSAEFWEELGCA